MALRYGYFDSEITGVDSEGMPVFDRAENSELFALLFKNLVTNGVLASPGDCFKVLAGSSGLSVRVRPGFGMINGRFAYDAAEEILTLETAPNAYSRIDWIVLRCNYADRLCELAVKTGTAASSPAAPALSQPSSGDYYELGLAQVRISPNQSTLSQSSITDTRPNSAYCGYITQLIDHLDTSAFFGQLDQFYAEYVEKASTYASEFQRTSQNDFNTWFDKIKGRMEGDTGANLAEGISENEEWIKLLFYMLIQNDIFAPLLDSDGRPVLDSSGNTVVGAWKYKEM